MRLDLVMHRVALGVGGMPQRNDDQVEPGKLQPPQFLRDEGLRQPRIALQHHDHSTPGQDFQLVLSTTEK